ncbi:hypothetical protein Lal_00049738 [Lupinus albus]|uniref:Putative Zf-FLZ domain-containing protein n=1 Tax=Lupinus albus TaxID=3870 RepID=A0A6A4PMI3_LUPAL|nr:putative Zf-FLZ domain-containing protein [Lupinus albus]KAF1867309.1 hypothetical protein Lal_00049738 [Lupinus albus]
MLGKKTQPMIGKLSELLVSGGGRAVALLDYKGSLLDMKMQSPTRGSKNYNLGGVGLGIVVDLDKPCETSPKYAVCVSSLNRSSVPIPVHSNGFQREIDVEDYTYVTSHVPNKTFTKVYFDGGEGEIKKHVYNNTNIIKAPTTSIEPELSFPTSTFLSSCHLCRNKLHGKDIYMYRGEKAFCSSECRSSQIMMDECKEKCRSEASRSVELSSSPYSREQIFSTRILAL